jgi:hypothetical protein
MMFALLHSLSALASLFVGKSNGQLVCHHIHIVSSGCSDITLNRNHLFSEQPSVSLSIHTLHTHTYACTQMHRISMHIRASTCRQTYVNTSRISISHTFTWMYVSGTFICVVTCVHLTVHLFITCMYVYASTY